MNKRNRGLVLVAVGLVLVLAGVGLYALQQKQDALAGQSADALLQELDYEIKFGYPDAAGSLSPDLPDRGPEEEPPAAEEEPMPSKSLSGYDLVGILRVPSVGIELPVLSSWSYALLNVAPCRYSGSVEHGNLIILGHNYKSHLQPLERVSVGDLVEFTDVNGVTHVYTVDAVDTIHGSDGDLLPSEHPLNIFTCTRDGQRRIVVRCSEPEN